MEEEKLFHEEVQLAEQIKQSYCKESVGKHRKETDPKKAAEIFHKIALIYKQRSPDKISLIRCVGLLNAAIVRNPSNICQIKADLIHICKHVLEQANANNRNANLITKANTVKDEIKKLRNIVDDFLKQTDAQIISNNIKTEDFEELQVLKAKSIQSINKTIANKYKEFMADISRYCLNIMGNPPCEYSIVGMGSLARNEITPYSDFEHIILLRDNENYEQHLEYFRWYSVIFHLIVLNFQESIIPSLNIKSLCWFFDAHTPRGISFDGMMPHACKFPLGRFEKTDKKPFVTELIKPVSEMLKYLSSEEDLKNGYHLADILTKTCFVFGNENIYDQFVNGVKTYLSNKSKQERIHEIEQQVRDDLDKFSTRFRLANLKSQETINIKQLVYRSSTLFVAALASIHDISESSCFNIIQQMTDRKIISQTTKVKLSYAVAIACEMRLRVYMEEKSQCDNPINLNESDENIKKFVSIVGVKNTINYFQIAYCLQCEVAKHLNFTKLHFYSDPQLINITIKLAFGMKLLQPISNIQINVAWSLKNFSFDDCIQKLETKNCSNYKIIKEDFYFNQELIRALAFRLLEANIFDEALELYRQLLAAFNEEEREKNTNRNIAWIYMKISLCFNRLHKYNDSAENLMKAIKIYLLTTLDQETDNDLAVAFNNIGSVLLYIHQYIDASIYLEKSLKIYQQISANFRKNDDVANVFNNIGCCLVKMQQYDNALIHLKQSLEIKKNISPNMRKDRCAATTFNSIGDCLMEVQRYDDALIHFKQSLEIYKNTSLNLKKDRWVAMTLNNIGSCLLYMHQYDNALIHLQQSLKIYKNVSLNPTKDIKVALTLNNIGKCMTNIQHYDDALIHLKQSLEIFKDISFNLGKDGNAALSITNIGKCLTEMQLYADGLIYLKQSLRIYESISFNSRKDRKVALAIENIAFCLMNMHQYDDALIHYKQSQEIYKNSSLNPRKDLDVSMSVCNTAICLMKMHQCDDALIHLKQALEIKKNISLNPRKDRHVAIIICNIGSCLMKMHRYDDALISLKQSLEIFRNISINPRKDSNVAKQLDNIGECLIEMYLYENALIQLKQSLEIKKNISPNPRKDDNVAMTLGNIGNCLMKMHQYDNALIHFKQALEIEKNISLNSTKDGKIAAILNSISNCMHNTRNIERKS